MWLVGSAQLFPTLGMWRSKSDGSRNWTSEQGPVFQIALSPMASQLIAHAVCAIPSVDSTSSCMKMSSLAFWSVLESTHLCFQEKHLIELQTSRISCGENVLDMCQCVSMT